MGDPDWKALVEELVEPLRDLIYDETYLAHKYGYPALLARTDAALFGISTTEAFAANHPADCEDCARKPQDLRDPLPPQAWEEHERDLDTRLGMWLVTCRCGWRSDKSYSLGGVLNEHSEHVRSAWEADDE